MAAKPSRGSSKLAQRAQICRHVPRSGAHWIWITSMLPSRPLRLSSGRSSRKGQRLETRRDRCYRRTTIRRRRFIRIDWPRRIFGNDTSFSSMVVRNASLKFKSRQQWDIDHCAFPQQLQKINTLPKRYKVKDRCRWTSKRGRAMIEGRAGRWLLAAASSVVCARTSRRRPWLSMATITSIRLIERVVSYYEFKFN